jgi:hypothetical protein
MNVFMALPVASAFLALWLAVRFPGLVPDSLRSAVLHFGVSLVLVWTTPGAVAPLVTAGLSYAFVAVLLVLSALVYAWLAVAGVLRFVGEAITH